MKTLMILALLSSPLWACPKGTTEWEGNCSADLTPIAAPEGQVKPSDEKPRRSQQPEWQTGGVKAEIIPSVNACTEKGTPGCLKAYLKSIPDDMSGKLPNGGVPSR